MRLGKRMCLLVLAAAMLHLAGCKSSGMGQIPQTTEAEPTSPTVQTTAPVLAAWSGVHEDHRPGDRFDTVIMIEGMEEPVRAEHVECADGSFCLDFFCEDFESVLTDNGIQLLWKYVPQEELAQFMKIERIADTDMPSLEQAMYDRMSALGTVSQSKEQLAGYEAVMMAVTDGEMYRMAYCMETEYGCISVEMQCTLEAAEGIGSRMHQILSSLQIKNQNVQ